MTIRLSLDQYIMIKYERNEVIVVDKVQKVCDDSFVIRSIY